MDLDFLITRLVRLDEARKRPSLVKTQTKAPEFVPVGNRQLSDRELFDFENDLPMMASHIEAGTKIPNAKERLEDAENIIITHGLHQGPSAGHVRRLAMSTGSERLASLFGDITPEHRKAYELERPKLRAAARKTIGANTRTSQRLTGPALQAEVERTKKEGISIFGVHIHPKDFSARADILKHFQPGGAFSPNAAYDEVGKGINSILNIHGFGDKRQTVLIGSGKKSEGPRKYNSIDLGTSAEEQGFESRLKLSEKPKEVEGQSAPEEKNNNMGMPLFHPNLSSKQQDIVQSILTAMGKHTHEFHSGSGKKPEQVPDMSEIIKTGNPRLIKKEYNKRVHRVLAGWFAKEGFTRVRRKFSELPEEDRAKHIERVRSDAVAQGLDPEPHIKALDTKVFRRWETQKTVNISNTPAGEAQFSSKKVNVPIKKGLPDFETKTQGEEYFKLSKATISGEESAKADEGGRKIKAALPNGGAALADYMKEIAAKKAARRIDVVRKDVVAVLQNNGIAVPTKPKRTV